MSKPISQAELIEAYDLWAESYAPAAHNPLMVAEERGMLELLPDVRRKVVLDLGCGTGRYSSIVLGRGAERAVALDLSSAMLARTTCGLRVRASMTELPLRNGAFDVIVSGLAVGHVGDLGRWMRESARVMKPDGVLLYSDFHPYAAAAGLERSFRGADGKQRSVPHAVHEIAAHHAAAKDCGLVIDTVMEIRAGIELQEPFEGSEEFYERWHGLPLVLVVRAKRAAT
jgi:malonyl-CoA O-methyltransferase